MENQLEQEVTLPAIEGLTGSVLALVDAALLDAKTISETLCGGVPPEVPSVDVNILDDGGALFLLHYQLDAIRDRLNTLNAVHKGIAARLGIPPLKEFTPCPDNVPLINAAIKAQKVSEAPTGTVNLSEEQLDETLRDAGWLGRKLTTLYNRHAWWSRATFGPDHLRGPLGPIRHLAKEAKELEDAPFDRAEYADCLLLIFDASRRAGIDLDALLDAAQAKMAVNEKRAFPPSMPDEPCEHIKFSEEIYTGDDA